MSKIITTNLKENVFVEVQLCYMKRMHTAEIQRIKNITVIFLFIKNFTKKLFIWYLLDYTQAI